MTLHFSQIMIGMLVTAFVFGGLVTLAVYERLARYERKER